MVHKRLYRPAATRRDSTLCAVFPIRLEQGSASIVMNKMNAVAVIPELGSAQEGVLMTLIRVEMKQHPPQIMETGIPKPWVTSWSSEKNSDLKKFKKKTAIVLTTLNKHII